MSTAHVLRGVILSQFCCVGIYPVYYANCSCHTLTQSISRIQSPVLPIPACHVELLHSHVPVHCHGLRSVGCSVLHRF